MKPFLVVVIFAWALLVPSCKAQLVITSGGTYPQAGKQNFFIQSAIGVPVVLVETTQAVTIENLTFSTADTGIVCCVGANVTLKDVHAVYVGKATDPNWTLPGWYCSKLVYAQSPASFACYNCRFEGNCVHVLVNGGIGPVVCNNDFIDPWCAAQFVGVIAGSIYNDRVVDYPFYYHTDQISLVQTQNSVVSQCCVICPGPSGPCIPDSAAIQIGDTGDTGNQANGNTVLNGAQEGVCIYQGANSATGNTIIGFEDNDPWQGATGLYVGAEGYASANVVNWGSGVTEGQEWLAYNAWINLLAGQGQACGPGYLGQIAIMLPF